MVTGVLSATGSNDAAAAMKKATGLNKDDFLKLFMTQLQNQDPMNPQDSSQFIAQLAQLTQVEQAYNTNSNLAGLLTAVQDSSTLLLPSFIGKEVLTLGNQVSLTDGGQQTLMFNLPSQASSLTVEIKDAAGKTVKTLAQGVTPAGDGTLPWDGRDNSGTPLPAGIYSFAVSGTGSDGSTFSGTTFTCAKIDGVKFAQGKPLLTSGPLEISLENVVSVKGVV